MSYNDRLAPLEDKGLCGDPERIDPPDTLRAQARQLAQLIRQSTHTVAFTGAGISTAVGIPDFRGPKGIWTMQQNQQQQQEQQQQQQQQQNRQHRQSATASVATSSTNSASPLTTTSSLTTLPANLFNSAPPSFTHMSLVALHRASFLHHSITQNVDNLHIKSGLPRSHLTELHGNIFVAHCRRCHTHFYHDEDVGGMGRQLLPGRSCERCGGAVVDNAIDWTTPLPRREFERAETECRKADLVLVFGSSLRIHPAAALPGMCRWKRDKKGKGKGKGGRAGKLVIVNLQQTHMDDKCELRVWGKCDDVMRLVCDELGVRVDEWEAGATMTPYSFPERTEEEEEDEAREMEEDVRRDEDWTPGSKRSGKSKKRKAVPSNDEHSRRSERLRKK